MLIFYGSMQVALAAGTARNATAQGTAHAPAREDREVATSEDRHEDGCF